LEARAGLIKLVDHLHTHSVSHSLLATYYKPVGQQNRQKVLIMITKDTDMLFDKTCQIMQELSKQEFYPKPIGYLRLPFLKFTIFKGLGPTLGQLVKEGVK